MALERHATKSNGHLHPVVASTSQTRTDHMVGCARARKHLEGRSPSASPRTVRGRREQKPKDRSAGALESVGFCELLRSRKPSAAVRKCHGMSSGNTSV
jgi:hypothetical protein